MGLPNIFLQMTHHLESYAIICWAFFCSTKRLLLHHFRWNQPVSRYLLSVPPVVRTIKFWKFEIKIWKFEELDKRNFLGFSLYGWKIPFYILLSVGNHKPYQIPIIQNKNDYTIRGKIWICHQKEGHLQLVLNQAKIKQKFELNKKFLKLHTIVYNSIKHRDQQHSNHRFNKQFFNLNW